MQQGRGLDKLAEFYHKHKTAVDVLAESDELFHTVKLLVGMDEKFPFKEVIR